MEEIAGKTCFGNPVTNPSNENVSINYYLPDKTVVFSELFDIQGKSRFVIEKGIEDKGYHNITLSLHKLPKGIYICCLKIKDGRFQKKIVKIN